MNNKQKAIIIRALGVGLFIMFTYYSTNFELSVIRRIILMITLFAGFYLTFPLSDNVYDTKDKIKEAKE